MSEAKVAFGLGNLSFSAEGSEGWVADQLEKILIKASTIKVTEKLQQPKEELDGTPNSEIDDLGLDSIAAKLQSKSGPDLALAACLKLTRGEKKSCSRNDLLAEMKTAESFYKATFSNNLTSSLSRLVKDQRLLKRGTDEYALPPAVRIELENKLAS